MPALQINKLTYQLNNGITLFENISFTLPQGITGLIGRNGVGKSMLASIITQDIKPTSGTVSSGITVLSFNQYSENHFKKDDTVASFLGADKQLAALNRIEQGSYEDADFELIGDNWQIKENVLNILRKLQLPANVEHLCLSLSGGERVKLQLWMLFQSNAQLLVLDEPSNHLDIQGKYWLINQLKDYQGNVLVVSHDRELLQEVDSIYELTSLGLTYFNGAYSDYLSTKKNKDEAIERQLLHLKKQKLNVLNQSQKSKEKAQKRASQGNKLRNSGSQAKVLLDGKKNKAEGAAAGKANKTKLQVSSIDSKQVALLKQQEPLKPLSLSMHHDKNKKNQQLWAEGIVLPFGSQKTINLKVMSNEKYHLVGKNGSGKSTLMKVLLGELIPIDGTVHLNAPAFYFDQYFSLLNGQLTMLENMNKYCAHLHDSDLRTLLAGIGFRGDKVFTQVEQMSGGEKMRLMILVMSNQYELPLLLLDEPDNHLDIESKEVLANALNEFNGSFIIISHDEYLINAIDDLLKIQLIN
jgi:ATPase subunit of ABC transporter with duplicated ATPase domains